jgi:hypothetical protein
MKRLPEVESVMTQVEFSLSRVERHFNRTCFDDPKLRQRLSSDFENIACKSIHTVAKGFVQLVFGIGASTISVDIPASTRFLVTGIRTYTQPYKVAFAASLS